VQQTKLPEPLQNIVYADFTGSFDEGLMKLRRTFKDLRHNKANSADAKSRAAD
jgi:hypothetical protein